MLTINFHNRTGIDNTTVWNTIVKSVAKDKIVLNKNLRLHNGRIKEGIISITVCNPRRNCDAVIDADVTDISQIKQVAVALTDITVQPIGEKDAVLQFHLEHKKGD